MWNKVLYVYVRTSGVARVCAFVHACMYVRIRNIRTWVHVSCCGTTPSLLGRDESTRTYVCAYASLGLTCLAFIGPAMGATRAYIRTNDVAAHFATVARRHRYSCAMSPHKTASSAN